MVHSQLAVKVASEPDIATAVEQVRSGGAQYSLNTPAALHPFVTAALVREDAVVVLATATIRQANDLAEALGTLIPSEQVSVFQPWETLPHERLSPRADTVGRRLAVLRNLVHGGVENRPRVIVAPIRSLLQPQVKGLADLEPVHVKTGQDVELDTLIQGLADAAYHRVDLSTLR